MTNKNTPTLQDTIDLVKKAHGIHNDKNNTAEVPYYWHLIRVMLRLQTNDLELLQIALLHDIVEDTDITLENLRQLGYSERVIEGVRWSSKNMFDLSFAEWMRFIGTDGPQDTVLLKIADISDNLGFERMRGLMLRNPTHSFKNKKTLDLRQKIDRQVEKKMRLHGDMGVYDRYYKGWNFMFENTALIPLIDQVFLGDFCHLSQLKQLTHYIPQEEMSRYMHINKINTWKISAPLSLIQDKTGQNYVALLINEDDVIDYNQFLTHHIDSLFIENQQIRDKYTHHITIINTMQYNKLKKIAPDVLSQFLSEHLNKEFDVFTYGIGNAYDFKKEATAWFVVCENAELLSLREKLSLPSQDFHITLAFDKSDVFGQPKNKSSIIYDNVTLWKFFVSQFYKKQAKIKP